MEELNLSDVWKYGHDAFRQSISFKNLIVMQIALTVVSAKVIHRKYPSMSLLACNLTGTLLGAVGALSFHLTKLLNKENQLKKFIERIKVEYPQKRVDTDTRFLHLDHDGPMRIDHLNEIGQRFPRAINALLPKASADQKESLNRGLAQAPFYRWWI